MEAILEAFLVGIAMMGLISLAITIALIIAQWKIFEKANMPGWYSIIPGFNMYKFFEMVGINGAHIFWVFLPLVGWIIFLVFYIKFIFRLATAFGKEMGFGIGLLLLTPIFFMILGFDKKTVFVGYHGANINQMNNGMPMYNQQPMYNQPMNGPMQNTQTPNVEPTAYPANDYAPNNQFQGQQPIMGNPYVNHNQQPTQTVDPTVPHDNGMGNPY